MRIISYSTQAVENKVLLKESTGDHKLSDNIYDLLGFITEPYENTIRICWDLNSTVSLFLRLLPLEMLEKIRKTHKCHMAPFSIFYIPDKVFSVTHIPSKQKANLYDLQQYFPDIPEPDTLQELQMLGEKLMYELSKMGLKPTKLTSPVAIYEECVMRKLNLPQLKDIPKKAIEMAHSCMGKLWIEAHTLGYFPEVYDYDMSSCFPNIAKDLVDFRFCDWIGDKKTCTDYHPEAIFGYADCLVTIYDGVMVSPILYENDFGLFGFTGTKAMCLSKPWMDFILRSKIGEFQILDSVWAVPKKGIKGSLPKPLFQPVTNLLKYKGATPIQTLLAKRISVGAFYGKLGEEREDEFGPYANFVWFSEISCKSTVKVAEFLYAHNIGPTVNSDYDHLIQIGVDGVMLTDPVDDHLNNWKLAYNNDALVVSSGLVYTQTTKPKGLKLPDILQMFQENPKKRYYSKGIPRRLTMADSLAKKRPDDIGKMFNFESSINLIHPDHDRHFNKLPRTGGALLKNKYRSSPYRAEKIKDME